MTCATYELFKDFQSAVVGIIGFAGVILTLFGNSWLARRQHKFEQHERRRAIEAGLYEELHEFLSMVERNMEDPGPKITEHLNIPLVRPLVSEHLIQDLGLLPRRKAQAALRGVMAIKELNRKLALVARGTSGDYAIFSASTYKQALAVYRGALPALREAVDVLKS